MRRWLMSLALALPLAAAVDAGAQQQPERRGPPHEWAFGMWTGGVFPPTDTEGPACYANATVIVLRDVVMRASSLDIAWRQRLLETVATTADGALEMRFVPLAPIGTVMGPRIPPDVGFGCEGGPNTLRVERRGENEIVFPNCAEFPSPLRRCTSPAR